MSKTMNERTLEIFRYVVDAYLNTGSATGSRTISEQSGISLSPASIRSILSDLESEGFLYAPHTSAGRLPTDRGLRYYVDGLLEVGALGQDEQRALEAACTSQARNYREIYEKASGALFGLSQTTSLIVAPKDDKPLKQIQFMRLETHKILVILVFANGSVENRITQTQDDYPEDILARASNFLTDQAQGKTLAQLSQALEKRMADQQEALDALTAKLVREGIAVPPQNGSNLNNGYLVVRGQSRLLDHMDTTEKLEEVRDLLAMLEEQETISSLLESASDGQGVRIFIGTENRVFARSGWSMILSPYSNGEGKLVGAIGVIGPQRLNYGRIIPMVDYTAQMMSRILER